MVSQCTADPLAAARYSTTGLANSLKWNNVLYVSVLVQTEEQDSDREKMKKKEKE